MPHAYSITDGTTTISLTGSGSWLENYGLKTPQPDDATVTDTVDIIVNAASGALVQTQTRAIEALLTTANRRKKSGTGPRVFVQAQLISDVAVWRSEIVNGYLELADDALAAWANNQVRATLYLERVPWWEGPETELQLSANGQAAATGGRTVINNGAANWLQIASAQVEGVAPAPVRVQLANASGAAVTWNRIHLATNAFCDPATFAYTLQAESRVAGGTTAANANASGGNELRLTGYVSGQTVDWTLSAALLQDAAGRWVRLLLALMLRSATDAQAETVQAQIVDSSGAFVLWSGPEVALPGPAAYRPFIDLGALPLPPGGYDTSWGALRLRLTFRLASGTATTYLDYIQLTPTDSYRVLDMRPASIANGALIVDNGYDDVAYVETGGARAPYVVPRGEPLLVWPGQLQRIYVLADQISSYPNITDTFTVRIWYRPRRLSI